ncbi:MAG: hypothetical protein PHV78_00430 [Patescibacteria group bacterium]|nr:hypothetical protein [Patescibacteria group bacterium]MDD5121362.1 hypothetical protein [Patescibacteria group bacterium]MDD5222307.1 hypothetical protein [Patescibacteria group bacterium]MDD5395719.1 hypothetical protein [Patescibacteria group bacterium]
MKLSINEKILWTIFKYLEKADQVTSSKQFLSIARPKTAFYNKGYVDYLSIKHLTQKSLRKKNFSALIYRLKRSGFIKTTKINNAKAIILTPKAKDKILQINLKQTDMQCRKDKKWQMVIFDIPEEFRKNRDRFRLSLKIMSYQKLQQSIWICPYDVAEKTQLSIKYFSLENYVKLLLVEEIKI